MSLKKNLLYNISYQILILIIPLITTPYIARVIGAEGVGIQSYTYSIANYFVLFSMLGVNNHGNRSIAMVRNDQEKLNKTFWSIYAFQAFIAAIMICVYSIYMLLFASENKIIVMIQGIYVISAMLDINWFFFGMEQFKITVLRNTIIKLITTCSIFIFVKDSNDLYLYSLILVTGTLISQCVMWPFLKKYISFTKVSISDIKMHIKPNLVLFIPVVAVSVYKIMDKIMIGALSTMQQVGFYENSEKIINIPICVIAALGTVMLPKMSNLQSKGLVDKSKKYISMSMQFIMFIAIGAAFGLIGASDILIPMFLGDKFIPCINIVPLLAITIPFIAWANVIRTQYLIPNKKDNIFIVSSILGAIVNIIINILLIKRYGAQGAVVGTIAAEVSVAVYQTIMVRKELDIASYFRKSVFYFVPGITMCIIIKIIGTYADSSRIIVGILQVAAGAIVYLIISLLYMIITKSELLSKELLH